MGEWNSIWPPSDEREKDEEMCLTD